MINIGICYAVTWLFVFLLYELGWSSLNIPLAPSLIAFFAITIATSLVFGCRYKQSKPCGIVWKKRFPLITVLLIVGFCIDWLYQGGLPLVQEYSGYDPTLSAQPVMGIPIVHVALIGTIIVAIPYLFYLYVSSANKTILIEIFALAIVLFLNKSRGYLVFVIICMALIYLRMRYTKLKDVRPRLIFALLGMLLALFFFISIAGNLRSGYAWNDCSYIREAGRFDAYPSWLTEHFMWGYTYITSCLGNLAYNIQMGNVSHSISELLFSFLPESISSGRLAEPVYEVLHLNACTGFISSACAYGVLGMYLFYIVQMGIYSLLQYLFIKQRYVATFSEPMLCFLVVVTLFYSPFTTSAVCYMPILLICLALYLQYQAKNKKVELVAFDDLPMSAKDAKMKGAHFSNSDDVSARSIGVLQKLRTGCLKKYKQEGDSAANHDNLNGNSKCN